MDTRGVVRLKMPGDGRPTAREYLRFLTTYCVDWKAIGLQLGLGQAALNVIGADHRDQNRECLRLTLESWLQMDIHATWSKLELAITNANRVNLGIDPLDSMPPETDGTVQGASATSSSTVASTSTVASATQNENNILSKMLTQQPTPPQPFPPQPVPPQPLPPQPVPLPLPTPGPPEPDPLADSMKRKPEMFDLTKIVIPKIMDKWEFVAEAFRYEISDIIAIREKGNGDLKKCCREFFMDWLQSNRGAEVGPKVWSTLLDTLNEVDEIAKGTIEEITVKVKKLK